MSGNGTNGIAGSKPNLEARQTDSSDAICDPSQLTCKPQDNATASESSEYEQQQKTPAKQFPKPFVTRRFWRPNQSSSLGRLSSQLDELLKGIATRREEMSKVYAQYRQEIQSTYFSQDFHEFAVQERTTFQPPISLKSGETCEQGWQRAFEQLDKEEASVRKSMYLLDSGKTPNSQNMSASVYLVFAVNRATNSKELLGSVREVLGRYEAEDNPVQAIETGLEGFAAYRTFETSFGSVNRLPNGKESLTVMINKLIVEGVISSPTLVTTAGDLVALSDQILDPSGFMRKKLQGHIKQGLFELPQQMTGIDLRQFEAEVGRLKNIEREIPDESCLVWELKNKMAEIINGMDDRGSGAIRNFAAGVVDMINDPATLAMIGAGAVARIEGRLVAERLIAAGMAKNRAALLGRLGVGGIIFHAASNLGTKVMKPEATLDWSPKAFARSIAFMGIFEVCGRAFGALDKKLLQQISGKSPLFYQFLRASGSLATEYTGQATASLAFADGPLNEETVIRELISAAQMTLAFQGLKIHEKVYKVAGEISSARDANRLKGLMEEPDWFGNENARTEVEKIIRRTQARLAETRKALTSANKRGEIADRDFGEALKQLSAADAAYQGVGQLLELGSAPSKRAPVIRAAGGEGDVVRTAPIEVDRLHATGKWSELVAYYDSNAGDNSVLASDRIAHEKYIVALNKTKAFTRSLEEVERYLKLHSPEDLNIDLTRLEPLDAKTRRNDGINGELLAGAGKAFRELSCKKMTTAEEAMIRRYAGIPAEKSLSESELQRTALELSTRFYEAGAFSDGSLYAAINAAHNNYRLGRLARAERFAWMAQSKIMETNHGNVDYWTAATNLEATLLTRDLSKVPELFAATASKSESSWMAQTTAVTLRDTSAIMRRNMGEIREDTAVLDTVVAKLTELEHNPELHSDKAWIDKAVADLKEMGCAQTQTADGSVAPALLQEYRETSERVYRRTANIDWRHHSVDLGALYAEAPVANAELRLLVENATAKNGGRPMFPPGTTENPMGLKERGRATTRVKDFLGDASQLTDIARASIAFNDLPSLYQTLDYLADHSDIVCIKDRFLNPYASGYRDILLKVRAKNGHVVELQLHLEGIIDVKNGPGHKLYEAQRDYWKRAEEQNRSLTPEETIEVNRLNREMRALYDEAYMKALEARSAEAEPVPAMPQDQAEFFNRTSPLILSGGVNCSKFGEIFARRALAGEEIVTVVAGKQETRNVAKEGDYIVCNPGGEEYVVLGGVFARRYKSVEGGNSKQIDGRNYELFSPKGRVRAVEVTAEIAERLGFRFNASGEYHFKASWGETMVVKVGDYLVIPLNEDASPMGEVYRIERNAFGQTYRSDAELRAIEIANRVHTSQVDKGGHPYIDHSIRVMNQMESVEEKIVAVLHDVIEDGGIILDELKSQGFSDAEIEAIDLLTHKPEMSYEAYIEGIRGNPLAKKVKLADLRDNMDLSRIPNPTAKDIERVEKYQRALDVLSGDQG